MKRILEAAVLLLVAAFLMGAFDSYTYKTEEHVVVVAAGDTLDGIAGRYYEKDDRKCAWAEFRAETFKANEKLTKNGRHLQPGDLVMIKVHKRVDK